MDWYWWVILLSWREHIFFSFYLKLLGIIGLFVRSIEEIDRKSWNKSGKRLNLNWWLVLYINRLINSFSRGTLDGRGKAAGALLTGIQGKALPLWWLIGWADARLSRQLCVFCIIKWSIEDPLIESTFISLTDLYFITPLRFLISRSKGAAIVLLVALFILYSLTLVKFISERSKAMKSDSHGFGLPWQGLKLVWLCSE